ncbi:hypothetical protein AAG570_000098 [Ranatra chinensis]|uniref:Reverse transcriptase domain-containing protein n=1 Tax=Ranatra chinensis TaxID=642074 RepID=A0ABD0YWQ8_9HEMI
MSKGQSAALVILDSEKAFDSVWIEGLVYKLIVSGISSPISKLIHSFLINRKIRVKVGRVTSECATIPAGVPQGSVLSPTLFNLYTSDILSANIKGVQMAAFADDLALYSHSQSPKKLLNRLENAVRQLTHKLTDWKIKTNPNKTDAIFFSHIQKNRPTTLQIGKTTIPLKHSVKYLGLHIDNKILWSNHVRSVNKIAKGKMGRIYSLLKSKMLNQRSKLILYKAIIRPTLLYGCPVWRNSSHVHKVDAQLNNSMRMIAGVIKSTPKEWLSVLSHIPPPNLRSINALIGEYNKIQQNQNLPLLEDVDGANPSRLISRKPPTRTAIAAMDEEFSLIGSWQQECSAKQNISIPCITHELPGFTYHVNHGQH